MGILSVTSQHVRLLLMSTPNRPSIAGLAREVNGVGCEVVHEYAIFTRANGCHQMAAASAYSSGGSSANNVESISPVSPQIRY
jgi:hypothetical protein